VERAPRSDELSTDTELGEPKTQEEWAEYYRLRYERLRKPLGQPLGSERDDPAEPSSIHIIAKMDGRVVGAGCWVVGLMFVRFRQMAVDSDCGGDSRERAKRERWLHAQARMDRAG